jgi:hypothetical protein
MAHWDFAQYAFFFQEKHFTDAMGIYVSFIGFVKRTG